MTANTITALRKTQIGFEGVAAVGTLTMDTKPIADDTVTIGDMVYTFKASAAGSGQVTIGAAVANSQANLVAAVNVGDAFNAINPAASMGNFSVNVSTITAKAKGTAGNSIVTTETFTAVTNIFNGATLGTTTAGAGGHGTAATATSIWPVQKLDWGDTYEKLFQPDFATGVLAANAGATTPVEHGAEFSFGDEPLPWEVYPHVLSMAIKGGVNPVYTSSVYRWTHTRVPTAHPNLDSVTLERYFSDGEGGTIEQRAAYCMLETLGVKYAMNDTLKWSGKGFGRAFATNTATLALSLPTPVLGVSSLSKVYADTSWGGVGGTQLTEQVYGWDLEIGTGLFPLFTAEGRTGLDFTKHMYDRDKVTLKLTLDCLVVPATYAAENGYAAAGSARAIQIYVSDGSTRVLKFNMLMRHTKPFYTKIDTVNGQDQVRYELVGAPDTTNYLQAILDHPSVAYKL